MRGDRPTDETDSTDGGQWPTAGSRRAFLSACGGVAALAGCLGPSDGEATVDGSGDTPGTTTGDAATADRTTATDTRTPPERISVAGDLAWTMAGNGPANDGFVDTTGPERKPGLVWDVPIQGVYTVPSPAFSDGTLYFGSDALTYAIDVEEGRIAWEADLDYLAHHYPAAIDGDGLLVSARTMQGARAGGGSGALYALSLDQGGVNWRFDRPVSSGPTVVGDEVYVTSSDGTGRLHALSRNGNERWSLSFDPEGDRLTSAFREPAVLEDTVYVTASIHRDDGTADGRLYAVDREDGSVRWRRDVEGELRPAPVIADGTVFAVGSGGVVHAVDPESGDAAWTHDLGVKVLTTPVTNGEGVFFLAEGEVFAVESGELAWRTDIGATRMNGMAVTGDGVYVGGSDVTALETGDGSVRWSYPIPGEGGGYGAPVVLDGVVFTGACIKKTRSSMYDDHMFALA